MGGGALVELAWRGLDPETAADEETGQMRRRERMTVRAGFSQPDPIGREPPVVHQVRSAGQLARASWCVALIVTVTRRG